MPCAKVRAFNARNVWGNCHTGVGRFVDKTFRRAISSSYYSFHSLGLKYFQFVFRLVGLTRHLAVYIVRACRSGSVTWPNYSRNVPSPKCPSRNVPVG